MLTGQPIHPHHVLQSVYIAEPRRVRESTYSHNAVAVAIFELLHWVSALSTPPRQETTVPVANVAADQWRLRRLRRISFFAISWDSCLDASWSIRVSSKFRPLSGRTIDALTEFICSWEYVKYVPHMHQPDPLFNSGFIWLPLERRQRSPTALIQRILDVNSFAKIIHSWTCQWERS